MRPRIGETILSYGICTFDILVFLFALLFGLGVVVLGPGAAIPLRIGPTLVIGFAVLLVSTWAYGRWFPRLRGGRRFSWRVFSVFVCLGLLVRVAFAVLVHPTPQSDFLVYWQSADHLVAAHEYTVIEAVRGQQYLLRAYRPPGASFLVALSMMIVGRNMAAPLLVNLVCFSLTLFCVADSCRRFLSANAAYCAIGLLVFWPSDITMAGLAQSESPAILGTALLLWLTLALRTRPWTWASSAGLVTGLSCLVRNSNLIVIIVLALNAFRCDWTWKKRIFTSLVATLCTIAVLLPWSLRNYGLLHTWVLVATNGGENLYTANNPDATGTWDRESAERIRGLFPDEALMNRTGFAMARDWISHHPAGFLKLLIPKLRLLVQTDDWGPYWALERGRGYTGSWLSFAKKLADAWWILLWILALQTLFRFHRWRTDPVMLFVLTLAIVPSSLFLVFESTARYHAPMVPAITFLAVYAVSDWRIANRENKSLDV